MFFGEYRLGSLGSPYKYFWGGDWCLYATAFLPLRDTNHRARRTPWEDRCFLPGVVRTVRVVTSTFIVLVGGGVHGWTSKRNSKKKLPWLSLIFFFAKKNLDHKVSVFEEKLTLVRHLNANSDNAFLNEQVDVCVFFLIFVEIFTFSCLQSLTLNFSLGTNSQKGMFWYDTPNVSWLRPSYEMVRQPTLDGFDLTKYQGRWYEVAFHDYTQYSEVSWPLFSALFSAWWAGLPPKAFVGF